jgi:hypothetical protein
VRVPPSGSQKVDFVRLKKIIFGWLVVRGSVEF